MQVDHSYGGLKLVTEDGDGSQANIAGEFAAAEIFGLRDPRALDAGRCGNKGSNLARLMAAGLPVPDGFIIEAAACRDHVARITSTRASLSGSALAESIGDTPLSPRFEMEVVDAYDELVTKGDHRKGVAVRSSASGEDSAGASCAGQYETVLHVMNARELAGAIRQCWASAWSDHAVHYRQKMNLSSEEVAVALVVQLQLDPETSGVMFTRSPTGPRTESLLISASYGLGEAIVQGLVTPDEFEVDCTSLQIRRRTLGSKAAKVALAAAGTCMVDLPAEVSSRYCLSDESILGLARYGMRVEQSYGSPQDIEWAIEDGRLYLLQTRPITRVSQQVGADSGSPVASVSPRRHKFLQRWKSHFGDHFPDPLMPMDFSSTVETAVGGIAVALRQLGLKLPAAETLMQWQPDGTVRLCPQPPRPGPRVLLAPVTVVRLLGVDLDAEWQGRDRPFLQSELDRFTGDVSECSDGELVEHAHRTSTIGRELTARRFAKYFIPGLVHEQIVSFIVALCTPPGERRQRAAALLKGILHRTAAMNEAIEDLAQLAGADPHIVNCILNTAPDRLLPRLRSIDGAGLFLERFDTFLGLYGVRCSKGMIPVPSYPTWAGNPEIVLGMVQSLVRNAGSQPHRGEWQAMLAASARSEVARAVASRWLAGASLRRLFLWSLAQSRKFIVVREESLWFGERLVAESRRILAEAGKRLHRRGYLDQPSDVLFLRVDEMSSAMDASSDGSRKLRVFVAARRRQYEAWKQESDCGGDWLTPALGQKPEACRVSSGATLKGLAASAGKVRGRVKVVLDQSELWRVDAGDILVCRATAPAWTAVFGIIAGIVTDVGGVLSHAAIVAREYQIPAVLGTGDATRRLTDGMEVVVDGESGHVTILRSQDCSVPAPA